MSWFDVVVSKVIYARPERNAEARTLNKMQQFALAQEVATSKNQNLIMQTIVELIRDTNPDTAAKNIQLGIVIYIIFKFGIRTGAHDLQNGVVGVTQLTNQNVKLFEQKGQKFIELDFVGKDYVRYHQQKRLPDLIYFALKRILSSQNRGEHRLFDIGYQQVNSKLNQIIPGLSAKVFRTMRASIIIDLKLQKAKENFAKDFD
jgi:hypothetical protein